MEDIGKDIRRRGSKAVAKLADTVQGMMGKWTEDNFSQFEETMDLIKIINIFQIKCKYLK